MAKRTIVEYQDDLDESTDDVRTVTFGYEGVQYEVDLAQHNRDRLDAALRPYVEASRRVGGRHAQAKAQGRSDAGVNAEIRAWAESAGYEVPKRGRIPASIRTAYDDAH